jgi:hypothetical protein
MRDLIYSGWRLKPAVSALIGFVQRIRPTVRGVRTHACSVRTRVNALRSSQPVEMARASRDKSQAVTLNQSVSPRVSVNHSWKDFRQRALKPAGFAAYTGRRG